MPRKLFKRWMPEPSKIHGNPALSFLGTLLHDPNLFHLNRHSISVGFFVGLFIAFLPIPLQIPLAAMAALKLRCNLPIAIILVWVSNPLTFPIIYFFEYQLGASLLMLEENHTHFTFSWAWLKEILPDIWAPLLLGSAITSLFAGSAGYLMVQWIWRWHVVSKWLQRRKQRNQLDK